MLQRKTQSQMASQDPRKRQDTESDMRKAIIAGMDAEEAYLKFWKF